MPKTAHPLAHKVKTHCIACGAPLLNLPFYLCLNNAICKDCTNKATGYRTQRIGTPSGHNYHDVTDTLDPPQ